MRKLLLISGLVTILSACSQYPSYGPKPLEGNQRYRVIVNVPGVGDQQAEDRYLPYCQHKRYDMFMNNPSAKLVADCHVVNVEPAV